MMAASKRGAVPKRPPGRPRVNETGSQPAFTQLSPSVREAVERVREREKRSLSPMLAILIEEALRARKELK